MSTESCCIVVSVPAPEPHPNADALDIVQIWGGYPCIVKRGSFAAGDLAVYVPIDSQVPVDRADFAFLASKAKYIDGELRCRIQATCLRGVFSMGLLIPAPAGAQPGDDVTAQLGVTKYGAPEFGDGRDRDPGLLPVYDVEGVRRWAHVLAPDELVLIEEKIDGQNARFVWHDGRLWCGSRTRYWLPDGDSPWARVARRYDLARRLQPFEDIAIFGEITADDALTVFDVLNVKTRTFMDGVDRAVFIQDAVQLSLPPLLYRGPWQTIAAHTALAEGPTLRPGGTGLREGWVVRPEKERSVLELGRVILKFHGQPWLLSRRA